MFIHKSDCENQTFLRCLPLVSVNAAFSFLRTNLLRMSFAESHGVKYVIAAEWQIPSVLTLDSDHDSVVSDTELVGSAAHVHSAVVEVYVLNAQCRIFKSVVFLQRHTGIYRKKTRQLPDFSACNFSPKLINLRLLHCGKDNIHSALILFPVFLKQK